MLRHGLEKLQQPGKRPENIGKPHEVQLLKGPDLLRPRRTAFGPHHSLHGACVALSSKSFQKSPAVEISGKLPHTQEEGQ